MNGIIVIFGITGDLAKRKIIPALYYLLTQKKLERCIIVGVGLEQVQASQILDRARAYVADADESMWQQMSNKLVYVRADVTKLDDFVALERIVTQLEQDHTLLGNRLFYLAIAAYFFAPVTQLLAQSNLAHRLSSKHTKWHRIVYEKPFGHDLESAHHINQVIADLFDDTQIYRMDHYLTKELVSNIALVRFTNAVFQPLWNKQYIDQIHIVLEETAGIEGRGAYYDHYGALKDVVQNHMMQLLALVAMESPAKLDSHHIRNERLKVLDAVKFTDGMRGQYAGYQNEAHVKPHSDTETFALLAFTVNTPRWAGVPFYLKTGKALNNNQVAIHIKFKTVDCLLTRGCPLESNWLTFTISPEATFSLRLNVKKPGQHDLLMPVDMAFCHSCIFGMRPSQAYEILLQEVIDGQQTSAVRSDEIEAAWRIIDTIEQQKLPLYTYEQHSSGPKEIANYTHKWGIKWY